MANNSQGNPVRVDKTECCGCDFCNDECPIVRFGGFASIEDPRVGRICLQCGGCVAVCTQDAISIDDLPPAVPAGNIPSADEALELIKTRRSVRGYKAQRVSKEHWEKLLEAVAYSPVGHNSGYVDVMIVTSPEILRALSGLGMSLWEKTAKLINMPVLEYGLKKMLGRHAFSVFSRLAPFYDQQKALYDRGLDPILFNAPAVMLFLAPKGEVMGPHEATMAAQTVAIYAPSLGLGTCYSGVLMSLFSMWNPWVNEVIKIPRGYAVNSALIVGYPKHPRLRIPYRKGRKVYYV